LAAPQNLDYIGSAKPNFFISQEIYDLYNLTNCQFGSNLEFNFIYCYDGKIVFQNAYFDKKLYFFQLPKKLFKEANKNLKFFKSFHDPSMSYMMVGLYFYKFSREDLKHPHLKYIGALNKNE
jgi:hypothetical protein